MVWSLICTIKILLGGVRKTYKLYVGGAFPRQRRVWAVVRRVRGQGKVWDASQDYRKAARDAVVEELRKPSADGPTVPKYNRGKVLYSIARGDGGAHEQFSSDGRGIEGLSISKAALSSKRRSTVGLVRGMGDKLAQVVWLENQVAGPLLRLSVAEATGVVAVLAPQDST